MILDFLGAHRHHTDKSSLDHNYLQWYERFLAPLRDEPVTILEIGVFGGESLRMWRDYFQRGRIVGMDIDPACAQHAGDRIEIVIGDSGNLDDLARAVSRGPFDVINDDGGHAPQDQVTAYYTLLPSVKPGGLYILEDVMVASVGESCAEIARAVLLDSFRNVESVAFYRNSFITVMKGPS